MFCYNDKERWYLKKVPRGLLPAVELDGKVISESDVILQRLEDTFGVLYKSMKDRNVMQLRNLERHLFGAWCQWLCYPSRSKREEKRSKDQFNKIFFTNYDYTTFAIQLKNKKKHKTKT